MSARTRVDKRKMRAFSAHAKNLSRDEVEFTVHGETESGRMVQIKILTRWSLWPCVARSFAQAWADQRASRVLELNDIDKSLPKEIS